MTKFQQEVIERLTRTEDRIVNCETLMTNHLQHHERIVWRLIVPATIAGAAFLFKSLWQIITGGIPKMMGG